MFNLKYKDESKIELFCNETKKESIRREAVTVSGQPEN